MRLQHTLLFIFFLSTLQIQAQRTNLDQWMGFPLINDQTPEWAKLMYSPAPNVFEVDKLYNAYYQTNTFEKNTHTQNYKHWRKHLSKFNYVQQDGSILMPDARTEVAESRAVQRAWQQRQNAAESVNTWTTIGPFVMKDGNNTDKSNQSCIVAMDHSTLDTNLVVNINQNGAVFKSTDGGQNWTLISTGEDFFVNTWNNAAITIHPTNTDIMLLSDKHRIYRTMNGGVTWSEMHYIADWNINAIEFKKDAPNIVNVSSEKGIYRSTDGGTSWTQIMPNHTWELIDHPTNPNIVYALVQHATVQRSDFYKSTDGGLTYSIRASGWYTQTLESGGAGRMAVTDAQTGVVYAFVIGRMPGDTQDKPIVGVFKSIDSGETWTKVLSHDDRKGIDSGQGYYDLDIGVSDYDHNIVALGSQGYWRTTDNFTTVNGFSNGQHADIQEMQVHGDIVWIASDGGMDRYQANITGRQSMNNGMYGSEFWGFDQAWNEDFIVGSYYHNGCSGSRQSFYGTGVHRNVAGGEPATGYISLGEAGKSWFSYPGGRIFPETVDGTVVQFSYNQFPNEEYWSTHDKSEIVPLLPYWDHHILGKENVLYRTTDGGVTFDTVKVFGTNTSHRVTGIEVSRQNPDTWYVFQRGVHTLWRTTDGGQTFTAVTQASGAPADYGAFLSLDPADDQTLFIAYRRPWTSNIKVYKTRDGGSSWTNLSTDALDNLIVEDIVAIPHSNGGVYILTEKQIFYRDNSHTEWQDVSNGLPARTLAKHLRPFYTEGKMRMASLALGAWEIDLEQEPMDVIAQPIVATDSVFCSRDTIQFESYSVINQNGATWAWSFSPAPLYIDDATKRNPKVVFGANGSYDVTLTIMDANGQTDTKTIADMVVVNSQCEAIGEAGNALKCYTDGDFVVTNPDLTNVTHFTMTAWIKPNQTQEGFGGIVTNGEWCAHCDDLPYGLCFDYWGNNLHYRWSDLASWSSTLNLYPNRDAWNYVAMTVTPDTIKIYLNNQIQVKARTSTPVDLSNLYIGHGFYSNSYRGEIDEVTVWTRALSADEIYTLRHITKDMTVDTTSNLVGYWQLNNAFGSTILDNGGSAHGTLQGGATLETSTAPIGGGEAELIDLDASTLIYDFADVGVEIERNECVLEAGKLVVSRLDVLPDSVPIGTTAAAHFWTLDYYGDNPNFAFLENVKLTLNDTAFYASLPTPQHAIMYQRPVNEHLNNWDLKTAAVTQNLDALEFNRNAAVSTSAQLLLTEKNSYFEETEIPNSCVLDTVPGSALEIYGASNDYVEIPALNLNTNTFTASAWVKANGSQNDWAPIVFCRGGSTIAGFGVGSANELRYHWDGGKWGWSSGAYLPLDQWVHLAFVVTPTSATYYLNGVPYTNNDTHNVEPFDAPMLIGRDATSGSRVFDGKIDEVAIWNRALSQDEVRSLMHITKDKIVGVDANLKAYFQFNEVGLALDKSGNHHHGTLKGNSTIVASTAPVGGGLSDLKNVSSGAPVTFGNTGVTLDFTTNHPNGQVVVSKLNIAPDTKPNSGNTTPDEGYWIVNNYGTNSIALDSIVFDNLLEVSDLDAASPSDFTLFKRASNAEGATWGSSLDDADLVENGKVTFSTGNGIMGFSQFSIGDNRQGVRLAAKAFLQGAYTGAQMQDGIRSNYHLSTTEPYTALGYAHKNGGGGESCPPSVLNASGSNAIIDWVIVELRDKTDASIVHYSRSALLQANGDIVDVDGTSALHFAQAAADDYYIAIRHRNHLGAMLSATVSLSSSPTSVDYTTGTTYGTNAQANLGGGVFGLWAGDTNGDGKISYQGESSDLLPTTTTVYSAAQNTTYNADFVVDGYFQSDINMDGKTLYLGADNERAFLENLILTHPMNVDGELGFVVWQQLP